MTSDAFEMLGGAPRVVLATDSDGAYGFAIGVATATEGSPLCAPLSRKPCLAYSLELQYLRWGLWRSAHRELRLRTFAIENDSGRAHVPIDPVVVSLAISVDTLVSPRSADVGILEQMLRIAGADVAAWVSASPRKFSDSRNAVWQVRCVEGVLEPGARVLVRGSLVRQLEHGRAVGYRGVAERMEFSGGATRPVFVSNRGPVLRAAALL